MARKKSFPRLAAIVVAGAFLLFATAALAGDSAKAAQQSTLEGVAPSNSCTVAAPSPTPQGTQQINVCNSWTAAAGTNAELFNTSGQSCTLTAGTTTWPFVQSAPLTIAEGGGVWITLISPGANNGGSGTYNYTVSCCPTPAMKGVTIVDG